MKKTFTFMTLPVNKLIRAFIAFIVLSGFVTDNHLSAAIRTSAMSGNFNVSTTWVGGIVPVSSDDIVVSTGHTVTLTSNVTLRAITVNTGAILNNGGFTLTLNEICSGCGASTTINGDYTGSGTTVWTASANGLNNNISGSGTISTTGNWQFDYYGATVAAGSNLTVTNCSFIVGTSAGNSTLWCFSSVTFGSGSITVACSKNRVRSHGTGSITLINGNISIVLNSSVLNDGIITVGGNVTGTSSSLSKWYNYANSTLNVAGTLLTTGTLNASYSGNTVNYNGGVSQTIKNPSLSTYWHLSCSNAATKNLTVNTIVNGDLTIQNTAQLNAPVNIDLKGNWINTSTNANPFNEQTGLVTFSGTAAQSLTANLAGGETFYNLTINNTSTGLTQVNNTINVTNTLTLTSGVVHTGTYQTYVTNNAVGSVTGHSTASYIDGYLRRNLLSAGGSYDFPVGNINAYELATVNITGAHTVGNLQVNFSNLASGTGLPITDANSLVYGTVLNNGGTAPGNGNANEGVWTITPNSGTANYDLTLYGRNYSNAGNSNTILKRANAASAWTLPGTYSAATGSEPIVVTRSGYSGFSQFAIGGSMTVLPVELISFEGNCTAYNSIDLKWSTASQTNNDFFTIERTTDGTQFEIIGTVDGAGNSSQLNYYAFTDFAPIAGTNYYRLKQTDYNGQFEYFNLIAVQNSCIDTPAQLTIFPNPVADDLGFQFFSGNNETVIIEVYDVVGKLIISTSSSVSEGNNLLSVDLASIASGTYMLRVKTETSSVHQKFVKK